MNYPTTMDLVRQMDKITDDPANRNPPGSLFMFTKPAQKKLDKLARMITDRMAETRAASGDPVRTDGYSGMPQNRR